MVCAQGDSVRENSRVRCICLHRPKFVSNDKPTTGTPECLVFGVGRWYIARVQYSSLGEGAAIVSLAAVVKEEGVQVRVQVG